MHVMKMLSLEGKTALVTGGAGKYGRQIVASLAEAGANVFIASRNVEALEKVAEYHRQRNEKVHALKLDLGSEESIAQVRDSILEKTGRIDVLVNNAVARIVGTWDDDLSAYEESWRINATGLHAVTRAIGKIMEGQKSGSIINIGSMMGMVGIEHHNYDGTEMGKGWPADYFFHKGGMINYTRFCASYFGRFNVRCNCVSPGGLFEPSQPAQFVKNYSDRTQLGRMANDTDLKGIIVFLASEASAYVTGANIPVDGGYTAK
ncbi:MAG: SDR family oxidoreductase [Sphaerochaetaceae bacterium]|nr:SDR family oxidoreductase [Sphaerochaetaceae bacterium]MDD3671817.1 SDR family oxidoreductase [Sphaerochaetaceae bacterium]